MTDNYDLDPHEHEAHTGDDHDHEAKAEAWPDDQPPVDDFADPGTEETATSSEETGSAPQEEVMEAEPRKSSALMPIIAGVGGLILLGAVLYWQFGRSSSTPDSTVPPPPPLQMAQTPPPVANAPSPNDVAPKTAMAPAVENAAVALPTTPPSMPAPMETNVPVAAAPAAEPVAPPTAFPAPSIAPPPSATPIVSANGESLDARLNGLSSKIDDLKRQLDQVNASTASPSSANAGVEERLTHIEQQLKQIEHGVSASNTTVADAATGEAANTAMETPRVKPSHHHHKKPAVHKTAKSTTHMNWVLRAATPTEAWVAKDEESADLHRVRIGDHLAGVGRVSAIHQVGDGWIVEGSTGTIR